MDLSEISVANRTHLLRFTISSEGKVKAVALTIFYIGVALK
jgi:hypothetical protein